MPDVEGGTHFHVQGVYIKKKNTHKSHTGGLGCKIYY